MSIRRVALIALSAAAWSCAFCAAAGEAETGKGAAIEEEGNEAPEAPALPLPEALRQTRVAQVEFRNAGIEEVTAYLASAGQVNIVVHPSALEKKPVVTVSLRNVTVEEALRAVCSASGLTYRVEKHYVIVLPRDAMEEELVVRTYNVPQASMRPAEKSGARTYLERLGVPFPKEGAARYNFGNGRLVVVNTPSNLAKCDQIVRALNGSPAP